MAESMELVHDWIHNPLAPPKDPNLKVPILEKAKGIFMATLRNGELKDKLQEVRDSPWLIQKPRIEGNEAAMKLTEVVTANRIPQLKLMIERGYVPDASIGIPSGREAIPESQANWSIAHEAVMANACDALLELMGEELDVTTVKSNEGWTLVHAAAYSGNARALKIVLDAGCPPDTPDLYKRTPLYWASICGSYLCARLLIWHKANLNAQDQWRNTPLTWAKANFSSKLSSLMLAAAHGKLDGIEEPSIEESITEVEEYEPTSPELFESAELLQKEKEKEKEEDPGQTSRRGSRDPTKFVQVEVEKTTVDKLETYVDEKSYDKGFDLGM